MQKKTRLVVIAALAVIVGFAIGRTTVPNVVVGAGPEQFKAYALEIDALKQRARNQEKLAAHWQRELCRVSGARRVKVLDPAGDAVTLECARIGSTDSQHERQPDESVFDWITRNQDAYATW